LLPAKEPSLGLKSESELKDSDSDDQVDITKRVQKRAVPEKPPKNGPEAMIEAKEALAKLAEEIAKASKEKVFFFPSFS
jgi:hypothetical protein